MNPGTSIIISLVPLGWWTTSVTAEQVDLFTYSVSNGAIEITDYPEEAVGEVEIPTEIDGMPVVTIGLGAFWKCGNLTSITIPNSVMTVAEGAFSECSSLTSITIPNSVTTIKDEAFSKCDRLTSVTISNSVTTISEGEFSECSSLTSITIPNSVTTIGEGAFYECSSLTSLTIPNSVTTIKENAFSHCTGLMSLTIISSSDMTIDDRAFFWCRSLPQVTFLGDAPSFSGRKTHHSAFGGAGPFGYDLRLMSVFDAGELPAMGNLLAIVAWVGADLHIRIFDADGELVIDKSEVELLSGWGLSDLKEILRGNPDESTLSPKEEGTIIELATRISNHLFTIYYLSGSEGFTSRWKAHFNSPYVVIDEATYPAASWLVRHHLDYDTDLDQDGLLIDYALDLDPHGSANILPEPLIDPTTGTLSLSFYAASPGIIYTVESSTDLKNWTTDCVTISDFDENNRRTASLGRGRPDRFMRLLVED